VAIRRILGGEIYVRDRMANARELVQRAIQWKVADKAT
jgi:hypothetical protein